MSSAVYSIFERNFTGIKQAQRTLEVSLGSPGN
jgi:hypothetical protein